MQFYNYVLKKTVKLSPTQFRIWLEPSDPEKMIPPAQPGQWVSVGFYNESGEVGERRPYSLANRTDHATIELLVKRRGEFSASLIATRPGTTLGVGGPFGQFIIKPEMRELVCLAGGIGIAPFVSMLRSLSAGVVTSNEVTSNGVTGNEGKRVTVFYSAKTKRDLLLLSELRSLAEQTGGKLIATVTQQKPWFWSGEKGRIGMGMIRKHVTDSPDTYYFMCGSKEFVGDLENQLKTSGVDEKRIVKEKFF